MEDMRAVVMQPSSAKSIDTSNPGARPDQEETGRSRPFDSRELDRLPRSNDNDPPYRPWWVIDRD